MTTTDAITDAMNTTDTSTSRSTSEYERERVPDSALKGPSAFWGMYAGEHTAGTEFMIGPLFVAWGASSASLIVGLLLGNLLAVLTWRYLTAVIACDERLTLYYKMERIAGRRLVAVYNLANGLLFCFLAGAMITVSATAVGPFFPAGTIAMPTFASTMPTGIGWILACVVIGAAMTVVALRGYGLVALAGHYAAPWMFLVFVACACVTLGQLGTLDVWGLLTPPAGTVPKISFLGVVCFAWFCNAAMHLGMADLSVLRFARTPSAGWASAAGMFLGHYVAWICAALLLVYWVRNHGVDPAVGKDPGTMVDHAVGWAGLLCVIIAGWTTANPTIYRAGLAFQGMLPGLSRSAATLLAGAVCIAAGIFPAFAMNLLSFVGLYGTILAPVGAIIVVDHFLADRVGILHDPAANSAATFNWRVLIAWLVPVATALYAHLAHGVFASYLPLPAAVACGLFYIGLARAFPCVPAQPIKVAAVRRWEDDPLAAAQAVPAGGGRPRGLSHIARAVGLLALAGTIVPPMLFMAAAVPLPTVKAVMLVAAVAWFAAAPWWMKVE
jgi:NCS1 family nucleobase:cation symporter-1